MYPLSVVLSVELSAGQFLRHINGLSVGLFDEQCFEYRGRVRENR
jgi:hypothetical protein